MVSEAVTAAEKAEYNDFCVKLVSPFVSLPQDVIWHYTNGASLISILKSGALYSTQISCLNDSSEFKFVRDMFRDAIRNTSAETDDTKYLVEVICNGLQKNTEHFDPWFVTCFSTEKDDLSQWRAYGNGENGYAIGFHARWLMECGRSHGSTLTQVCYDLDKAKAFVAELAAATINFFIRGLQVRTGMGREAWAKAFLSEWGWQINHFQSLFKDSAFCGEKEWRLVHQLRDFETKKMEYVQKASMLSRHLPLRFPPPADPESKLLPVAEIMVGPGRHKEVSRISVGDLLRTCGYKDVELSVSSIPYQTT
ncbi:conserved hypothetical protein [Rhodospirillaceae bacterium LM-1]|nr:conserved hypothetical protein [Rhodospirillaceae bacterium LM-1]